MRGETVQSELEFCEALLNLNYLLMSGLFQTFDPAIQSLGSANSNVLGGSWRFRRLSFSSSWILVGGWFSADHAQVNTIHFHRRAQDATEKVF